MKSSGSVWLEASVKGRAGGRAAGAWPGVGVGGRFPGVWVFHKQGLRDTVHWRALETGPERGRDSASSQPGLSLFCCISLPPGSPGACPQGKLSQGPGAAWETEIMRL